MALITSFRLNILMSSLTLQSSQSVWMSLIEPILNENPNILQLRFILNKIANMKKANLNLG